MTAACAGSLPEFKDRLAVKTSSWYLYDARPAVPVDLGHEGKKDFGFI
jgi:hypothetical protein